MSPHDACERGTKRLALVIALVLSLAPALWAQSSDPFSAPVPPAPRHPSPPALPSFDQAIASRTDLWGELAMRQPNGPEL